MEKLEERSRKFKEALKKRCMTLDENTTGVRGWFLVLGITKFLFANIERVFRVTCLPFEHISSRRKKFVRI